MKTTYKNFIEGVKATITESEGAYICRIYKQYGTKKQWHLVRSGTMPTFKQAKHFISVYCDFE